MNIKWSFLFKEKKLERLCSPEEDIQFYEAVKHARWLSMPGEVTYMVNMDLVECVLREKVQEPEETFDLPESTAELPPIDDQVA